MKAVTIILCLLIGPSIKVNTNVELVEQYATSAIELGESADNAYFNAVDQVIEEQGLDSLQTKELQKYYYL